MIKNKILFFLFGIIALSSCQRDLEIRLIDTWDYKFLDVQEYNDFDRIFRFQGKITFNSDGTGIEEINELGTYQIFWEKVDYSQITYVSPVFGTIPFDVEVNKRNRQLWEAEYSFFDSTNNINVPAKLLLELTR